MTRRPAPTRAALLLAGAMLAGCQTPPLKSAPPAPPADCADAAGSPRVSSAPASVTAAPAPAPLAMQGQMSIKLEAFGNQPAKGLSLGFFFTGHAQSGDLELMTLLGSEVAHLHWQPNAVELVDTEGAHRYANLAELSQAALGEALPLDTLVHWMQGRADPALPALPGTEPDTFEQLGWQIDVRDFANKKLTASRAASPWARGVRIKVYLDR